MGSSLIVSHFILLWMLLTRHVYGQRPEVVKVGAVFTHDSVIGRVAKVALEAAAADINADPRILNGTTLNLVTKDSNCSVFMGAVEAFQVLEEEVVAIIGPQSSSIAHMISNIANGLQVPLISFAATDPTLSALQFPFFLRTIPSDSNQMSAMADLIDYHGWRQIIAVFVDDDYGRNGISILDDELAKKLSKISYKVALPPRANPSLIIELLNNSKVIGPRVYVVHANPDSGLTIFAAAQSLQMMIADYVWLATDWLCATLDSLSLMNQTSLHMLQGVVGLRQHIPKSGQKRAFVSRWRDLRLKGLVGPQLNTYALYAYDTMWTVAHSINDYLNEHGNITFTTDRRLLDLKATAMKLEKLRTFDGGNLLLEKLRHTNFLGLTGMVQFDPDRNRICYGYDVINVDRTAIRTIGYWSKFGFSVVAPEMLKRKPQDDYHGSQKLKNVTWVGGKKDKPRGWEIAHNERPLRIGVPKRVSFEEFVTVMNGSNQIQGYCIDVFHEALNLVPYAVPFRLQAFGDGRSNPSYDRLVKMVADDVIDAVIGDITIVTNRTRIVDFTQPYVATGLVIVAPISNTKSNAWVFLQPFTPEMWGVTAAFFALIAVVIWILEHRINNDFRGPPKRQIITMFLFSFSTLFKTNQEDTVSTLGRMVMVVWLFLLMVITSSYTASLTSILTVRQLSSPITGIDSLIASRWPIGFQVGSFARSYLTEGLNVHQSRLIALGSPEQYESALRKGPYNGGVAAIIDELPYVELFLSNQSDFGIVGSSFTKSGWGFAFQRDSPLAVDMSTAILKLSESGELQKIHDRWFCNISCPSERRHHDSPNQLHLTSFWGLFLMCGIFTLSAFLVFLLRTVRQFIRYKREHMQQSPSSSTDSSNSRCSQLIYSFFDFIDEKEEAIKKMFNKSDKHQPQVTVDSL